MPAAGRRADKAPRVRLELAPQPRARRTHAERRAETRAKILAAVVDSIAEQGFGRTTAQAISARAGVTWGAVQHQFGGKDQLLLAVLEDSFNRFAERMEDIGPGATTLDERASMFIDRAWEHYRSRHFRSTFEILLSYLGREEHSDAGDWRGQMARAWDGLWSRVFADANLSRGRSLVLQNFVISALTGLAQTSVLAGPARTPKAELDLLKETLARALRSPG